MISGSCSSDLFCVPAVALGPSVDAPMRAEGRGRVKLN
jgi:hypothetical protein